MNILNGLDGSMKTLACSFTFLERTFKAPLLNNFDNKKKEVSAGEFMLLHSH